MIPYGRQDVTNEDIDAVVRVLRGDFLTQGPAVPQFEQALATKVGASHAVAVNSATSALHIACLALGLGPGDLLWTSPNTFVASANCGIYCGAQVDFVDIDPVTYNLSAARLAERLEVAEREGRLPKVVIPVHFAGQPCDMAEIGALAKRYGFRVIEDASHAVGASYQGEPVGNGRYSDVTVFSFHPVKIITTGEGGAACTNSADLARSMRLLRGHGVTREPAVMAEQNPPGGWYYEQVGLGFNYRMTDLQAALGFSQLDRLESYVSRRHELADRYDELLAELPVLLPKRLADRRSALHLYVVGVDAARTEADRADVFAGLRSAGIGANVHYIPVHTQPFYRKRGFNWGDFPEAEAYYHRSITIPLHPRLSAEDQDSVVAAIGRLVA